MAYTIPPKRCGFASHFFLACLLWTLVVSIPTSMGGSGDLCRFCACTPSFLNCMGVFREGNILERLSTEEDLTHFNIARPPTKLSSELFEEHPNITKLALSQNDIASLDGHVLPLFRRLRYADLSHNVFQRIPTFGNNTFLRLLVLRANAIQMIPKDLRFDAPNISFLTLQENLVKDLKGSHLPQRLTSINLSRNKIAALNQDALEGLILLRTIYLSYNNISFISSYALALPSLTSIYLQHNPIAVIEPSALPGGIVNLMISGNGLLNISFLEHVEGLTTLATLRLMNLHEFDKSAHVPEFKGLITFKATNVRNPEMVSIMLHKSPMLTSLLVNSGKLMAVNELRHAELLHLDLCSNRIGLIGKPLSLPSLERLLLRNNRLTALPNVSGLLYLKVIDVAQNEIVELKGDDLLNLPQLNKIVLDHNKIIRVSGHFLLRNLHGFSASHNQIYYILDMTFINAQYLNLDGNSMKTFRLAVVGRMSLNSLSLNSNEIDVIDPESFQYMHALRILSISDNKITHMRDLPLFPALVEIILDNNPLQFIGTDMFRSLPKLMTLSLKYTQITAIPNTGGVYPFLKAIDLQANALEEFPINITHNFPNLITLKLNDNMINRWNSSMVTCLKELQYLDISNNPIKAIDIDTTFPRKLGVLALGSALTDYMNPRLLKITANISIVELKGSRSVRIPDDFLCNGNRMDLTMDGLKLERANSTCSLVLPYSLTLSNVLIERSFLYMIISQGTSIRISNTSLLDRGKLGNNTPIMFAKELQQLSYTHSRLNVVPRVIAPSAWYLNLSGNHLTTFCFGMITKFFPSLRMLSLANNRIRVLSSCGMWSTQHNLQKLHLEGNELGQFSRWMCEDGLVFLSALRELDLSNNNVSFISKDLIPQSLLENRYGLNLYSYNNPLICNCDQRWLADVRDNVEVIGGQCTAPQDNNGQEISDLMGNDFPCQPMMSDDRICTIAADNSIVVECPALAKPNPVVAWRLQEAREAAGHIGVSINLSGSSSSWGEAGGEQQALGLTLDKGISGEGEQNFLISLTCLASNIRGSIAIDVSVNVTHHDLERASTMSRIGVNQSLSVECLSKCHTGAGRGGYEVCTERERIDRVRNVASRMKITVNETSGLFTLLCCFLLHILSKIF